MRLNNYYTLGVLTDIVLFVDNGIYPDTYILHYHSKNGKDFENCMEGCEGNYYPSIGDRDYKRRAYEEEINKARGIFFQDSEEEIYTYNELLNK